MKKQDDLLEWESRESGVTVRAILVKDVPYELTEGFGVDVSDLWVLFLSITSNDYWVAYGIVDSLEGEPHESLNEINLTEAKKLSIVIGNRWRMIENEPMQRAQLHNNMAVDSEVVNELIMSLSYTDLMKRRLDIEWEALRDRWKKFPMVLSMN